MKHAGSDFGAVGTCAGLEQCVRGNLSVVVEFHYQHFAFQQDKCLALIRIFVLVGLYVRARLQAIQHPLERVVQPGMEIIVHPPARRSAGHVDHRLYQNVVDNNHGCIQYISPKTMDVQKYSFSVAEMNHFPKKKQFLKYC
jgi:hypothetical protein